MQDWKWHSNVLALEEHMVIYTKPNIGASSTAQKEKRSVCLPVYLPALHISIQNKKQAVYFTEKSLEIRTKRG